LNELSGGRCTAPEAEELIRGKHVSGEEGPGPSTSPDPGIHHVADVDGVLGLDPLHLTPLRIALARVEARFAGTQWLLLLPRPGRLAGLRGPAEVTTLALEAGAIVVASDGGPGWIPLQVGPAIQWRVVDVQRPLAPPTPSEASRAFASIVIEAAGGLASLGATAGTRPRSAPLLLPRGYPTMSASLLDRALTVLTAYRAGMDAQSEIVSSFAVLGREGHLRELRDAALDAVSAAASWPSRAMQSEVGR
ncbi:MAG TPA: hypothetical protein VLR88_10685, partial [Propionibacteriaceae bacterium]|nr:hypothetical protein [Propionibacteriaceae bacterium]